MIFIPLLIVCLLIILVGTLMGKARGESTRTMLEELLTIGESTFSPLFQFTIVILIVVLFLLGIYYFLDFIADSMVYHF